MNLSKEVIAFRRGKIIVSSITLQDPRENIEGERTLALLSLMKELGKLGYYLSSEIMCKISIGGMKAIHDKVLPYIYSEVLHRGGLFKPLYPGFPEQVIQKSKAELELDKYQVYNGDLDGFIKDNPWRTDKERKEIENDPKKELTLMTPEEFMNIPQDMMLSGNSLGEDMKEELVWFLSNYPDLPIPEKIPFKETLCMVTFYRPDIELLEINDVLRYGLYLLGGFIDLRNVPKRVSANRWNPKELTDNPDWRNFKSLSRKDRRDICNRIELVIEKKGFDKCITDAKPNYGHWLVLSERVHPREYSLRFPDCSRFFTVLKSNSLSKDYRTFGSKLRKMYDEECSTKEIAEFIIKSRPGEFIRRIDSLLRRCQSTKGEDIDDILGLLPTAKGMSNKSMIDLLSFYENKSYGYLPRLIKIPGNVGMFNLQEVKPLVPLPKGIMEAVMESLFLKILNNIGESIETKDLEGKTVFLDPDISKIRIPQGMRDSNTSIPKGSRIKLPEDKIIRFFVHWYQDPKGPNEDLDLHAFAWDGDREKNIVTQVGWNTEIKFENAIVHSGDVLNRPGHCAEYIDVDMKAIKELGFKYLAADIMNYKGKGLNTLPCWVGYMVVDKLISSTTWIPENVDMSVEMSGNGSNAVEAFIIDIENSEMIIADFPESMIPVPSAEERSVDDKTRLVDYLTFPRKYTIFDIFDYYYKSRGANVVYKLPEPSEGEESDCSIDEKVTYNDLLLDPAKIMRVIYGN